MNFVGEALASATCRMHSDQIAPKTCWKRTTAASVALSMERALIMTHRSWATNPYGPPTKMRPNPQLERDAIFNQMEVQVGRQLDADEVRRINLIIKSRAYRFAAAAETDWL